MSPEINFPGGYKHMDGELAVSDRNLSSYAEWFNFTKKERDAIPHNAVILNIGSGSFRTFESELHVERPDLKIISIDPSLGAFTINREGKPNTNEINFVNLPEEEFIVYAPNENLIDAEGNPRFSEDQIFTGEKAIKMDKIRKKLATRTPGAVAGSAIRLPLADKSVDIAFDLWGPIRYLRNIDEKVDYLKEVKRVMKPAAKLYASYLGEREKAILDSLNLKYIPIHKKQHATWLITS